MWRKETQSPHSFSPSASPHCRSKGSRYTGQMGFSVVWVWVCGNDKTWDQKCTTGYKIDLNLSPTTTLARPPLPTLSRPPQTSFSATFRCSITTWNNRLLYRDRCRIWIWVVVGGLWRCCILRGREWVFWWVKAWWENVLILLGRGVLI